MKVEDERTRQSSSQHYTVAGELLSSITLLNAIELIYHCEKNCSCDLYTPALKMFKDRAIFVDQHRRNYEKFCVQRLYPKIDIIECPLLQIDNSSSWALTALSLARPYINAPVGLNFESLIHEKFGAYFVYKRGREPVQMINGKPKPLRVFEAFSQIESNAFLSIFIECINPLWYIPIATEDEKVLAQWRLMSSIHDLYQLGNENTIIVLPRP